MVGAYANMLDGIDSLLLTELNAKATKQGREALSLRAKSVVDLTGDFRLDAFASRLSNFTGSHEDIEGIASLAANNHQEIGLTATWMQRN